VPLPWIKMWLESLEDPKLTRLSLAERGAWWGILELAGRGDAGGKILSGGLGLEMDEIADALHIKTDEDRQALESMITKMGKRGSLKWDENILTVIHWEERQRIPPSARPEAIAERVKKFRERRKETERVRQGDAALATPPSPTPSRTRGKVSRDSKAATGPSQDLSRDSKAATRQVLQETSQDDAVLAVWSRVKNFPEDSNAATRFLAELKAEFPDVDILEESKTWAAAKLSMPLATQSMPFKQLRAWMLRARQFQERQKPQRGKKKGERDYKGGKYGHMVKR